MSNNSTIDVPNNTTNSSPSELILSSGIVLTYIELAVHPISLMTTFFFVALIIKTSVFHANLKRILLGQSAGIVMFEMARITYVLLKVVAGNVFMQGPIVIQMFGLFGYILRNVINHVLIAERTMATINFRTYGQSNGNGFTCIWLIGSIAISAWTTISQNGSPWSVTPMSMVSICVVFGLGLTEIITLSILYLYNVRKYQSSRTGVSLNLDHKYQLSENIRTARQFVPTFVLHFLNSCVNNGMSFLIFFGTIQHAYSISSGFIVSSLFNAISGALVNLIIIYNHPVLKKKAKKWLLRIVQLPKPRVDDQQLATKRLSQPRNIYGQHLLNRSERENHFKMLQNQWMQTSIDVATNFTSDQ
ncbi:hypothetical protein niasHS_001224 [Heterodera schachtii]|uniref:Gustatory receptor n=2 Tax=Heterodera TaxID=34509 RepID=A0ABD2KHT4_HETSC